MGRQAAISAWRSALSPIATRQLIIGSTLLAGAFEPEPPTSLRSPIDSGLHFGSLRQLPAVLPRDSLSNAASSRNVIPASAALLASTLLPDRPNGTSLAVEASYPGSGSGCAAPLHWDLGFYRLVSVAELGRTSCSNPRQRSPTAPFSSRTQPNAAFSGKTGAPRPNAATILSPLVRGHDPPFIMGRWGHPKPQTPDRCSRIPVAADELVNILPTPMGASRRKRRHRRPTRWRWHLPPSHGSRPAISNR